MKEQRSQCDVLLAFTNRLAGMPYVIVGDTSRYPEEIESDVDMVLPVSSLKQCGSLIRKFADQEGLQLVQLLQHEICAWYFVLVWMDRQGRTGSIALDICNDYYLHGKPLIIAPDLLRDRRIATAVDGTQKGFFVPAPDIEFIYYLTKKVDKYSFSAVQFEHLRGQFLQCPEKCLVRLQHYWPAPVAQNIFNWVRDGDWQTLQNAVPQLHQGLFSKCRPSAKDRWREFVRKVRRVLQPTGLVVALLGPDGCGKSTISEQLQEALAPAFRGLRSFHLRPYFLSGGKGGGGGPVTDPHGKLPRGRAASLAKLLLFLVDYSLGYWIRIRPLQVSSHLVMFDRYYHDLIIDPKRYRYSAPMWAARLVGRLVSEPDLFLVLDAPAEVIQARKQEVPLAETERQRGAYLAFARSRENCIIVRTDHTVEQAVAEARAAVFWYLERRLRARRAAI